MIGLAFMFGIWTFMTIPQCKRTYWTKVEVADKIRTLVKSSGYMTSNWHGSVKKI